MMKRSPALPHLPFFLRPTTRLGQICLFFFFFFIQLYCKNWILFCVLCLDYLRFFLRVKQSQISLFFPAIVFLFLLFFCVFIFFYFFLGSDSKGTIRSGLITILRTVWQNRGLNGFLFFSIDQFLSLKNRDGERFTVFPIRPYGLVRVSKP